MMYDEKIRNLAQKGKEEFEVPEFVKNDLDSLLDNLTEGVEEEHTAKVTPMPKRRGMKWAASIAAAFLLAFLVLPNTTAGVAHALADLPVVGTLFEAVTFRNYSETAGNEEITVETPKINAQGNTEGANAVSEEIDALNEAAVAQFQKEHKNLTDGGVGALNITYSVISNTDRWYTVKVVHTETAADTGEEEYYYTFDKKTGNLVILSDLFKTDAYITDISDYIKEQMRAEMKADDSKSYFIDSDMPEEDFKEIDPNQDFYMEDGALVICFDQFEVAPGYMGTVQFHIPKSVYSGDLQAQYK